MSTSRRNFLSSVAAVAATTAVNPITAAIKPSATIAPVSGQACYIAEKLGWKLQAVHNHVACFTSQDRDTFNQFIALDGKNDLASMVSRLKGHEEYGWQIKQRVCWAFDPDECDFVRSEEIVALAREMFGDAAVDRFLQVEAWQKLARSKGGYLSLSKGKYGEYRELSLYSSAEMTEEEFVGLREQAEQFAQQPDWTEEDRERQWSRQQDSEDVSVESPVVLYQVFTLTTREVLGPDFAFVLVRPEFALHAR